MSTTTTMINSEMANRAVLPGSILSILSHRHFNEDEIPTLRSASDEERLSLAAHGLMDALSAIDRQADPITYKLIEAVLLHVGRRLAASMLDDQDGAAA